MTYYLIQTWLVEQVSIVSRFYAVGVLLKKDKTMVTEKIRLFECFNVKADIESTETMIPETQRNNTGNHHHPPPLLTDEGLIIPRKPHNPILDNADRQNLHKELLFNQKIGKNVLNQKCELQKAMEKRKDSLAKKEMENSISQQAPELKKVIADRAKRLEEAPTTNEDDKGLSKEFLQARANLKRNDSKS